MKDKMKFTRHQISSHREKDCLYDISLQEK